MKKPILALLLILSLFTNHFSKKLTIFADNSILNTSFEDGDFSMLTKRGEYDGSTLEIKKDGGKTGSNYLWISDRKETWNGAQYDIAANCKEGEEYIASVAVKTEGAGNVCLSMQYAEDGGEDQYKNLKCTETQAGKWVVMSDIKFTIPPGAKTAYLYFENTSGTGDFGIDDFEIKTDSSSIEEDIPSLKDVYKKHFKFGKLFNFILILLKVV